MEKTLKIPKKRKASLDARKARNGYFFVAPFVIGVILVYLPILLDSVWFSFSTVDRSQINEMGQTIVAYKSVGLQYYKDALFGSATFVTKLLAGMQELIFEVPAVVIFSLFIAVVLNQKMLGRAVFRAIFFVPVIISTGIMERIIHDDIFSSNVEGGIDEGTGGGGSEILSVLDVQKLFGSMKVGGELVTYVVKIVNDVYQIINYSGVQMLIFLAGLQSISPSIYEAAQIEGATGWESFWKITLPMISPMILVNTVYSAINAFTRSTNPAMSAISATYSSGDGFRATAMAWIYFSIIMIIIAAVVGIVSSFIFYQRRD